MPQSVFQYSEGEPADESQVRGIGTDVGIVSCMVFLAQFILSSTMVAISSDIVILGRFTKITLLHNYLF